MKALRKKRGWTQADLAKQLGISKSYVAQLETDVSLPSDKLAYSLQIMEASPLSQERGDIMRNVEIVPLRRIRILSYAQMGALTSYEELPADFQETIPTDIDDPKAFALYLRGDSMEPRYRDGDIAVLRPSSEPKQQDVVVARFNDGSVVCKIYTREKNSLILRSVNPVYEPIRTTSSEVSWVYPVDSVIKRLWK